MAVVLGTQDLMNQGNALLQEYDRQGLAMHQITYRQKDVGAKIEDMIANFKLHEVMRYPADTMSVLRDVKSSFETIKTNINTLEKKEKEMSGLIQNIIARQQQGNAESANVQAQIANTQTTLNALQEQINVTQANLNKMAAELDQLQRNIADAERKVQKKKKKRKWWVIATVLTMGVAGIGAIGAFKSVDAAKKALGHRREIYANAERNFRELQFSFSKTDMQKKNLETDQGRRRAELAQIGDILNRLQPALQDTAKYRNYLLKLSDAFNQVNSYVQNLDKNLETVQQVQAAGHTPDGSMNITITNDFQHLHDAWTTAKMCPAVQMALNLHDPNNAQATIGAIKSLNLAGRKKRSLGPLGGDGRYQG